MKCTRCNNSDCLICSECDEPSCGFCECERETMNYEHECRKCLQIITTETPNEPNYCAYCQLYLIDDESIDAPEICEECRDTVNLCDCEEDNL